MRLRIVALPMRPGSPDWDTHFETRIVPFLESGVMFDLINDQHIYLTATKGDGNKFAARFAMSWKRMPQSVRDAILQHWNSSQALQLKRYPYIPYIVLLEELMGQRIHGPGLIPAKVMDKGFLMQFWSPAFEKFPDVIAETIIAHELAHVFQFATYDDPVREIGEGRMEKEADELTLKWGYDMADVERWACAFNKKRPRNAKEVEDLVRYSKASRYGVRKAGGNDK